MTNEDAAEEPKAPSNGKKEKTSPDYALWARDWLQKGLGACAPADTTKAKRESARCKPFVEKKGTGAACGTLYVVATPIGNLGDMTLRGLETLAAADVVACEDTRVTGGLLHRFGIKKPLLPCHDHNEADQLPRLLDALRAGQDVAFVSDAGTPMISDPGYKIVEACRAAGLAVVPVPGASALLTALVGAGLPTDRFFFAGFLPVKSQARQQALQALTTYDSTLVFYESPQRLAATLADMAAVFGETRRAVVAREMTKLYETFAQGTPAVLAAHWQDAPPKGEIVIVLGPPAPLEQVAAPEIEALLRAALQTQSVRDATAAVVAQTGARKKDVYAQALRLADEKES